MCVCVCILSSDCHSSPTRGMGKPGHTGAVVSPSEGRVQEGGVGTRGQLPVATETSHTERTGLEVGQALPQKQTPPTPYSFALSLRPLSFLGTFCDPRRDSARW